MSHGELRACDCIKGQRKRKNPKFFSLSFPCSFFYLGSNRVTGSGGRSSGSRVPADRSDVSAQQTEFGRGLGGRTLVALAALINFSLTPVD